MELFSKRLSALRRARNLTQAQAARLAGISPRSYQRYESGQREPALSAIAALARLFGVSSDYLLGLDETPAAPGRQEALLIRPMTAQDPPVIAAAFAAQGWDKPLSQYERYWDEQQRGLRQVLVGLCQGEFAGYLTLLPSPSGGPWKGQPIPEICDFNVLKKFRGRGFGWALMDAAEALAARTSSVVTLGVGLYTDYGTAQRMYIKRGYLPDGSGLWYGGDAPLPPGESCVNDDDLVLYLSKKLQQTPPQQA